MWFNTPMAKLIIDTDTASDDAVALIMALRHVDQEVVAITTVAGNCNVDQATNNALYTAELCDSDVPVFRGSARPLLVEPRFATWFHGDDGLSDQGYPSPRRSAETENAVTALIRSIRQDPGCILVALGPLTNIALAVHQAPDIVNLVDRFVVMGGTANAVGNVTPAAEFNLWFDPHAAAMVFSSGLPIEMVTWEVCRGEAGFDKKEQTALRALDTEIARFMLDCNTTALTAIREQSGGTTLELPDPTAMAVAIHPDIVTAASKHCVAVEYRSELTRGMAVVDSLNVTGRAPNVDVIRAIDNARFKEMVFDGAR